MNLGFRTGANSAPTDLAALIVTSQTPVPVQAPLQPLNSESSAAVGISVTIVPCGYSASHAAPHSIPPGELVTVPKPLPVSATVSLNLGTGANSAPTDLAALIVTSQAPVPVQVPLQPLNSEPMAGVALSETLVPSSYSASQAEPQAIPLGALVTMPGPFSGP